MIEKLNEQMVLSYEIPLQRPDETLINLLHLGARLHVTINTHSQKGIGKTYSLIEYARKNCCVVVVSTKNKAQLLKEKYKFDKIYGQDDMWLRKMQVCVVDDDVNINKLLKDMECYIVTGFYNPIINKTDDKPTKTLNEEIVENFKSEVKQLNIKLQKLRDKDDYSMYKNIINSYREVIKIIQDLDWKFKYSEYKREVSPNIYTKELAIWEQNGDGIIRNYKKWNIEEYCENKN